MGYTGYIKVPRELFASGEWTDNMRPEKKKKRRFSRTEAQIDLLQAASYTDGRIVHCAAGDMVLKRGQLLASTRYLGERWGWGQATVSRYLQELQSEPRNSIRIRIEKGIAANTTLITICNFDGWYLDGYNDETQNGTPNETDTDTPNETESNNIKYYNSNNYKHPKHSHETLDGTGIETPDGTPYETYIEIKNSNTGRKKDKHTQVSDLKEGVVGGTVPAPEIETARKLIGWVETRVPAIASMREPLTVRNVVWMLRKYSEEDIRRIIATMQSKGAHLRNSNAYATFVNYAKLDIPLRRKREARGYSYEEYCNMVGTDGRFSDADFIRKVVGGRPLWFKKQDLQTIDE